MRSYRLKTSLLGVSALSLLAFTSAAHAQSLALNRLDPAPAGDRMFGVPSPYAAGHLTPHLMLLGDYAHNPLKLQSVPDDTDRGAVVKNQLFLHLNAGIALWDR